mmetsp:Transcript_21852/g.65521  ORF Transcript_21852/g.65521 Transcript_21852/m.65521 type:complete len:232 (+) Transcript_21852:217-912(+)
MRPDAKLAVAAALAVVLLNYAIFHGGGGDATSGDCGVVDKNARFLANLTVRVRSCPWGQARGLDERWSKTLFRVPHPPVQRGERTNGATGDELLSAAYRGAPYRPACGASADLDYVPYHCFEALARATCPQSAYPDGDAPRLGTFTYQTAVTMHHRVRAWADAVEHVRKKVCPGAPIVRGRLAIMGIELPTVWLRAGDATAVAARVEPEDERYVPRELMLTAPYPLGRAAI